MIFAVLLKIKYLFLLGFMPFIWVGSTHLHQNQNTFWNQQMKYNRVKTAYNNHGQSIANELKKINLESQNLETCLIAYKHEKELELWGRNKGDKKYTRIKTYKFCALSGHLGPKLVQGDGQVPEGFYYIDRFNGASSFHLSLGINYPNKADIARSNGKNPGGDIFIHGKCVTIGCIPITDTMIEELYIYMLTASRNLQVKSPVVIFPCKMSGPVYNQLLLRAGNTTAALWKVLQPAYNHFNKYKSLPLFTITPNGKYSFSTVN